MDRTPKKRKTKTRKQGQASPQTASIGIVTPVPTKQPPVPTIPPETRDQLTSLMQELLLKTHELSFEYSTSDCHEITECPLALQARELFKTVKKLHRIVRQVSPTSEASYVR